MYCTAITTPADDFFSTSVENIQVKTAQICGRSVINAFISFGNDGFSKVSRNILELK